jgi:uncharacterized protein (DUF1501 family)
MKNRRDFIKTIGSGVLGGAALQSGFLSLLANAAVSENSEYKALVCIKLDGGNDAFNTLVPTSSSVFKTYSAIRQELALEQSQLHSLLAHNKEVGSYALHPSLKDMARLFNIGKLSVVANLGNLIEPTSKSAYLDRKARLPNNLFSHKDQTEFEQTLNQGDLSRGWAGRIADAMNHVNINQQLAMNISLSGENNWQRGNTKLPYVVRNTGVNIIDAFSEVNPADFSASRAKLYRQFMGRHREHVLQQHYSETQLNAWVMAQYVSEILKTQPEIHLPIMQATSPNGFVQSLGMVMRLIAAHKAFEVKRQIFYVSLGSFDTHRHQSEYHAPLLDELNSGMNLFYHALSKLRYEDQVITFTTSEFGRTLTLNGNKGTDHGWTGHHFVMGGGVKGQQIVGEMPDLNLGSEDDIGEGRLIPKLSFDQYAATLSRWFGLSNEDVHSLFPNLKNFTNNTLDFLKG